MYNRYVKLVRVLTMATVIDEKRKFLILEDKNILKGIFIMMIPLFLSNMLKSLHDIVDSYFLARMDLGKDAIESALAAVNIHWPIYNIFNALGVGLGIAGVGIISQYIGSKKEKEATKYAAKLVTYAVLLGALVNALLFIFAPTIANLMGAKDLTFDYAVTYFRYRSFEFIFVYLFLAYQAIRQAEGDTMSPVILSVISIVINMIMTWLFISVFNMGIHGAGLSTLLSQLLIMPFALFSLLRSKKHVRLDYKELGFDKEIMSEITRFAMPSAASQAFSSLGFAVIQAMILSYGDTVSSGFGTGNRISSLILNPVMAIGSVLAAYVGQNIGNQNPERAKASYRVARNLSVSIMLFGIGLAIPFSKQIAELIVGAENQAIVKVTVEYSFWILGTQPLMALFQNYVSVFNGSGNTKYSFIMSFTRLWLLRVPLVFMFMHLTNVGYPGIWYSMMLSNIMILGLGHYLFKKVTFERRVIIHDEKEVARSV